MFNKPQESDNNLKAPKNYEENHEKYLQQKKSKGIYEEILDHLLKTNIFTAEELQQQLLAPEKPDITNLVKKMLQSAKEGKCYHNDQLLLGVIVRGIKTKSINFNDIALWPLLTEYFIPLMAKQDNLQRDRRNQKYFLQKCSTIAYLIHICPQPQTLNKNLVKLVLDQMENIGELYFNINQVELMYVLMFVTTCDKTLNISLPVKVFEALQKRVISMCKSQNLHGVTALNPQNLSLIANKFSQFKLQASPSFWLVLQNEIDKSFPLFNFMDFSLIIQAYSKMNFLNPEKFFSFVTKAIKIFQYKQEFKIQDFSQILSAAKYQRTPMGNRTQFELGFWDLIGEELPKCLQQNEDNFSMNDFIIIVSSIHMDMPRKIYKDVWRSLDKHLVSYTNDLKIMHQNSIKSSLILLRAYYDQDISTLKPGVQILIQSIFEKIVEYCMEKQKNASIFTLPTHDLVVLTMLCSHYQSQECLGFALSKLIMQKDSLSSLDKSDLRNTLEKLKSSSTMDLSIFSTELQELENIINN
eukprot:403335204